MIRDDPPVDDSDIYLKFKPAPQKNNGLIALNETGKSIKHIAKELNGISKSEPFQVLTAYEVTNRYQRELDVFFSAADFPYFGYSSVRMNYNFVRIYDIALIAQLKGKLALYNGKLLDATEIGIYLIRLGYKFEHCQGPLLCTVIGMRIKKCGLELISQTLNHGISREEKFRIRDQILKFADSRQGYIKSLRYEYSFCKDKYIKPSQLHKELLSGGNKFDASIVYLPFAYKPNRTARKFLGLYKEVIDFQLSERKEISRTNDFRPNILSGNFLGEIILSMISPNFDTLSIQPKETEGLFQKVIMELN